MDVLQETNLAVLALNPTQINGVDENGSHDQGGLLKPYAAAHAAIHFPFSAGVSSTQKGSADCQRATLSTKDPCTLNPSSPLSLTEVPEPAADESSTHAISLTSCVTKGVSPWSLPEDCDKTPFTMMEPGGISTLTEDCLMQPSRTCLGCFMESKDGADAEPGISLKMGDVNREYDGCSMSDMGMHAIMPSEACQYGDQLLSDQLLGFPVHKAQATERRDVEKSESDSEDPASKNLYEGLLLDKCNGEEALLSNTGQDWGYFESFISESKMELLDLCSKNELSVNLFSEEDVDNYMFDDDDDDSTLSSDVCSLKIRYESFQDNMREKTNVLQEETQFSFFPSVLVNCTKKDGGVIKKNVEGLQLKGDEMHPVGTDRKGDKNVCPTNGTPDGSPKRSYIFDFNNSTEDSGEYSDDSSCTGSSSDTLREAKGRSCFFSREKSCSSSQLNYRLRAKRKVRYSEDYLYDVDSIENEKNVEKREKLPVGPKEEEDDDWCPKKRRKSSRKEPPVIIKYIIINRFKGEKHMLVKLGKIDPAVLTVNLTEDAMNQYEKLAPLKSFWQKRQQDMEERRRLVVRDKHHFRLNGRNRSFSLSPTKRKYKIANRLRIQRIQAVEQLPSKQGGSTEDDATVTGVPLTIATSSRASTIAANDITHTSTPNSRSQERDDKRIGNKVVRIRKFKSEARLRSKKMKDMEEDRSMTDRAEICAVLQNQDSVRSVKDEAMDSAASSPHLCENHTANASKKSTFVSATCSPDKTTPSVNVATSVPVVPGGYLQTLLDASDTSSSTGISFFPQQPPRQYPVGLSQEEKQFTSLQLAQSCVLSPPSESELQQSPQNCQIEPNFTHMWHSQLGPSQAPFAPDIPETPIMPNSFSGPLPVPMADNLSVSGYSQLNLDSNRLLYEKNYLPEQPLPSDGDYQACQAPCGEGHLQLQRGTLNTDNGRLISFDSVGSLSATSSNYSSLSLKSCEKDGEDDMNDNFLAHCSPKLVIQQSVDAITPLRESTDLLDISNFTPDKFRHSSLSEMSPPDTPNLSPQVMGPEMKGGGVAKTYQEAREMTLGGTSEMKWDCNLIPQQEHQAATLTANSHQFQFHTFNDDDGMGLIEKDASVGNFDEQGNQIVNCAKGPRSKKKITSKQIAGQGSFPEQKGTKKTKAPKTAKAEKSKAPRQNSRSPKKLKTPPDGKTSKGQAGGSRLPPRARNLIDNMGASGGNLMGVSGDWPLVKDPSTGWSDRNNLLDDDQREFEEPSNILSNIASGMAEVQRFMMASIEPLWSPASGACQPPEANSLKLKTLKILAGTTPDSKRKGAASPGVTKGRKSTGKAGKNQSKFNASHPFFPQLALGCNMFDKPTLGTPSTNGPAHKKMYRHKTSAKFPRVENSKGKRAERDPSKDLALMASYEKLRIWVPSISKSVYTLTCVMRENYSIL
ncbi:neurite extension and migration factor isoform X2 [Paramormyrops kingsleyae]|uniref:Neurite extension and migration factor n=2 Tax=Paramormyrops kingsleyae TaxID=1676925 RepID=A0A3B3QJV9_9TELE|nr:neurite extension and migration factor isoform X2 [Paramormyrops kingsleyae]